MIERIKKIRKALRMTQSEFAKKLNLQQNTICLFETGKRNPSERTIDDMCNIFNVSKEYLLNGIEPMFIQTPSSTMEKLKKEFNLDEFSFNLVYEYLKLAPGQREAVRDFFYHVIESKENIDYTAEAPRVPEELEKNFLLDPKNDKKIKSL